LRRRSRNGYPTTATKPSLKLTYEGARIALAAAIAKPDELNVGAIGVGSGTGDQDVEVARAGLATLGAQDFPPG
jgi:hypothetical protein